MHLPDDLHTLKTEIDLALGRIALPWLEHGVLGIAMHYGVEGGGKRLRPMLVMLLGLQVMASASPEQRQGLLDAACGIELLHLASLIADDLPCMDNDEERHGRPTLHRRFGESTAILASLSLISEGYRLLTKACQRAPQPLHAIRTVAEIGARGGVAGLCLGQYLDLACSRGEPIEFLRMLEGKTGALFEMALLAGWAFHPAPPDSFEPVSCAARHLGIAFQCFDDLRDAHIDGAANGCSQMGPAATLDLALTHWGAFKEELFRQGWTHPLWGSLSCWLEELMTSGLDFSLTSLPPLVESSTSPG